MPRDQVALGLHDVMDADDVVVDVAEVDAMLGEDRGKFVAGEAVEHLAFGIRTRWSFSVESLHAEDPLEGPGRWPAEDLRLGVVDGVVEVLDGGEIFGDAGVEHVEERVIGAVLEPLLGIASDVAPEVSSVARGWLW